MCKCIMCDICNVHVRAMCMYVCVACIVYVCMYVCVTCECEYNSIRCVCGKRGVCVCVCVCVCNVCVGACVSVYNMCVGETCESVCNVGGHVYV